MRAVVIAVCAVVTWSANAQESAYRREDVEQIGPYVEPDIRIQETKVQRNDSLMQPGGRLLLKQMPHGDIVARVRDRKPQIGYRLEW